MKRHHTTRRGGHITAALAIAAVASIVAGCTAGPEPSSAPNAAAPAAEQNAGAEPVVVGGQAPLVTNIGAHLPLTWEDTITVAPGWSSPPMERSGLLLGFAAPTGDRPTLRYVAATSAGTILWQAERPATCTGFALSQTSTDTIAVLTDLDAHGASMSTTASGYDLVSGDRRWGPVAVPGSLQGPGLVFASPAPASAMGAAVQRIALDPATGKVIADEAAAPERRIIGEYDGIVITADADFLYGISAERGETIWRTANPDGIAATAAVSAAPSGHHATGVVLVGTGSGAAARLIDPASGVILATDVQDAAFDALSSMWIVLHTGTLTGIPAAGDAWTRDVAEGSALAAVGNGLVYAVSGGAGHVFNSLTGADAHAYDPSITSKFAVPQAISMDGAGTFEVAGRVLLATTTER